MDYFKMFKCSWLLKIIANYWIEYKLEDSKNQHMLYYYFFYLYIKKHTHNTHTLICTHTRYNQSFNYIIYIKGNQKLWALIHILASIIYCVQKR